MAKPGRNTVILSILFFGPLLFYIFLLTGTNNFAKLPVLTSGVDDVLELPLEAEVREDRHLAGVPPHLLDRVTDVPLEEVLHVAVHQ